MARSIGRPMRYFLAKRAEGPCLIVAERMEEIRLALAEEGLADQFHPSYTRMVPAHYIVEITLIGCPDPNPVNKRFFTPQRNEHATDLDEIGQMYIGKVAQELNDWLDQVPADEPLGVLFSGGIDSGAVLLLLNHLLLQRGESPARLKAFTLSVAGTSSDATNAKQFLDETNLSMLLEVIDVTAEQVDFREAIRIIEDYKPLDVQSATMAWALMKQIRQQYPDWKYLVDGDGGDENLKDYPIEDNPELTIVSVLNNLMLYQEGWGVDSIKHSLTYSGGQSRGHVRSYAPAAKLGFRGFSPFALTSVIGVAEGIPFIELTDWDHEQLYRLKGEIVKRGVEAITGVTMPIFEKCRFQHGAVSPEGFAELFPADEQVYRDTFADIFIR
jgi:asparagine synthase (glutamine-hydrolysing)